MLFCFVFSFDFRGTFSFLFTKVIANFYPCRLLFRLSFSSCPTLTLTLSVEYREMWISCLGRGRGFWLNVRSFQRAAGDAYHVLGKSREWNTHRERQKMKERHRERDTERETIVKTSGHRRCRFSSLRQYDKKKEIKMTTTTDDSDEFGMFFYRFI